MKYLFKLKKTFDTPRISGEVTIFYVERLWLPTKFKVANPTAIWKHYNVRITQITLFNGVEGYL